MSTQWTGAAVRQSFLDFFQSKAHAIVPSSPLVLPADPTLLFANAGMNQFKDYFLGVRAPTARRVADTQKCIRVSGKHNDLEEVGVDTYHHTFFEMLGNWSFGDYYKKEAIGWAWELLTGVWGLPKDRLWATIYRTDDEAEKIWRQVTDIAPDRIRRFGEKDNFWEMGETGPCGPCSEIHIDLSPDGRLGPELVNAGSPELMEIWNLVFIQYNRRPDGQLEELPSKHVDTGMGLERVVAVLQGKRSNYDTDLLRPLIDQVAALTGRAYEGRDAVAMRVIADHLRALSFAIADGVLPANDGRGYVLRRLLRRAVRYGRKLDLRRPFLGDLFPTLERMMGAVFPEIVQRRADVLRALRAEEESFALTLDRGLELFDAVVADLGRQSRQVFPGAEAFKLYDTYGFPLDLTELMASELRLQVDRQAFDELMEAQRARGREARKTGDFAVAQDQALRLAASGVRTEFVGYDRLEAEAEVVALLAGGEPVAELAAGQDGQVVLSCTPFYGESGGQLGDQGALAGPAGDFEVRDAQKPAEGLIVMSGRVTRGRLANRDRVRASVAADRRRALQRHHTATHLLNFALRQLVNPDIKQAGSLVAPDRLRFDFNHYEAVPADKLRAIEDLVNRKIMEDAAVATAQMAFKDVPGSGIVAVFDEKYGDVVRVLDVGGYSRELCGGTHVSRTGEIGSFRIVAESSVAAGIRRIEAVCGEPALQWTQAEHDLIRALAQRFSCTPDEILTRVANLADQVRKLEKQLKQKTAQGAAASVDDLLQQQQDVQGVPLIAADAGDLPMDALRQAMDALRMKFPAGVLVLGSRADGKACFVAAVSDDWVQQGLHAGQLIGRVAKLAGGGGGGQPQKAQAGGKDAAKVGAAIAAVPGLVAELRGA